MKTMRERIMDNHYLGFKQVSPIHKIGNQYLVKVEKEEIKK